jgi:hypothetical protein
MADNKNERYYITHRPTHIEKKGFRVLFTRGKRGQQAARAEHETRQRGKVLQIKARPPPSSLSS